MKNNNMKLLAFQMARLPFRDQKWLFKQLSQKQKLLFELLEGPLLLKEARRFSQLDDRMDFLHQGQDKKKLPEIAHSLMDLPPHLIAIILKLGKYDWQETFLEQINTHSEIAQLLMKNAIKPATQQCFFESWQQSMEPTHE